MDSSLYYNSRSTNLQGYISIVDNIWATPDVFKNIYLRLSGLHTTMSFCDSLGI